VAQTGIVQRPLIGPVAERSIGLVTSRNRSLSPAAAALVGTLKEYLALQGR
jgi:LysR family transcriptional regulator, carnitine catabolism transcriptional activator